MEILKFKNWLKAQKPKYIDDPKTDYEKGWNTGVGGGGLGKNPSKQFRRGHLKGQTALHNYANPRAALHYSSGS